MKSVGNHGPSPSSPQESLLPEIKDRTYLKFALIFTCLIMKFKDSRLDNRSDQHFSLKAGWAFSIAHAGKRLGEAPTKLKDTTLVPFA